MKNRRSTADDTDQVISVTFEVDLRPGLRQQAVARADAAEPV